MKIIFILLATLLLYSDDTINLLEDLDNASKISTRTKLNISKTPSIVSVLHTKELQKIGITNLYTALETVPGIEISMGLAGAKQINMRGNKSLVTDKLKFMIDGISINNELSGANHFYLNMPIQNIERIEIIRGPASALYGSFAHIGVINVITKAATRKKNTLFIKGNTEGFTSLGFTQHLNEDSLRVALSASFERNDNTREYSSYSLLPSNTLYKSYENFTSKSLNLNLNFYKNLSFVSKYLELETQNYFGYGAWPITKDPKSLLHTSFINEFTYTPSITREINAVLKAGYKMYSLKGASRILPYPQYDFIGEGDYKEKSLYTDLALNYSMHSHNIILGTYISRTKANNTSYKVSDPTLSEVTTISIEGGGLKEKIIRNQYALYLSDIYTISSQWSTNIGLRYDYYSDTDSGLAPKAALLYSYDEKQSYKLMYQHSFRVPAFTELYGSQIPYVGDKNLKPETINTLEFAYHYQRTFDSWFSINFFYSTLNDFIFKDSYYQFKNGKKSTSYGSELEFKFPIYNTMALQANYSYVNMQDEHSNPVPLIANHLANIMFSYQISREWNAGSRVRYVGERRREVGDTRENLTDYTRFDQTFTYMLKSVTLQASCKNIFNTHIIFPASLGNEITTGTYEEDIAQDGRLFWLSAEWRFR